MNVLVTGGAGYIGCHVVRRLHQAGISAWAFDDLSRGHAAAVPADGLVVGDIADGAAVERSLRRLRIDVVVHCAGKAYVGESLDHPEAYYQTNLAGSLNLLAAMRRCGLAKIVFSSTCAVYGSATTAIVESTPLLATHPYGRSKLAVEWALADYCSAYGFAAISLRYFNAAGAAADGDQGEDHAPETRIIPLAIQTALGRRKTLDVFGDDYPTTDGTCIRDYVHVDDLAEAHRLALDRLAPGRFAPFNLGTGRGYSVNEVIRHVESAVGAPISISKRPRRAGDPPVLVASAELAARELGWRPRHTELKSIVESAVRWHRDHPHGFATNRRPS